MTEANLWSSWPSY